MAAAQLANRMKYSLLAKLLTNTILFSIRNVRKFNRPIVVLLYNFLNLSKRHPEEFSALIYYIYFSIFKSPMQGSLKFWSIVTEDERMHIKVKWNRCVAKLSNPFHRIESSCHSNFVDVLSEGSDIRYNIHKTSFLIRLSVVNIHYCFIDILKLRFQLLSFLLERCAFVISRILNPLGDFFIRIEILPALLFELFSFRRNLALKLARFALLLTRFPKRFFFLFFLLCELESKLHFLLLKIHVRERNRHTNSLSISVNGFGDLRNLLERSLNVRVLNLSNDFVAFPVIGAHKEP